MHDFTEILMMGVQIISFVLSLVYFKYYKYSTEKYFPFFLGYVLVTEISAHVLAINPNISNQIVFNIFTIVSVSFYLYWFWLILKQKKVIYAFVIVFLISIIIQLIYDSSSSILYKIPLTTGIIIIISLSTLFFYNMLQSNKVMRYNKDLKFWIVVGLLIFYVGFLPLELMQVYIDGLDITYYVSMMLLNLFMYGSFSIGFLSIKK